MVFHNDTIKFMQIYVSHCELIYVARKALQTRIVCFQKVI